MITPHYDDAKTVYVLVEKDQWYCVTTRKADIMICQTQFNNWSFEFSFPLPYLAQKLRMMETYENWDSNSCLYL